MGQWQANFLCVIFWFANTRCHSFHPNVHRKFQLHLIYVSGMFTQSHKSVRSCHYVLCVCVNSCEQVDSWVRTRIPSSLSIETLTCSTICVSEITILRTSAVMKQRISAIFTATPTLVTCLRKYLLFAWFTENEMPFVFNFAGSVFVSITYVQRSVALQ